MPHRSADTATGLQPPAGRLELPLAWEAIARPPSPEMLDAAEQANLGVLSFLLQGVELEARPRPLDDALAEAIAPLRVKLDMITDMLARLCYREVEMPPRRWAELAPGQFGWLSPQPSRAGDWLRIRIYFDPVFRDPVVLFGKVSACRATGGGDYAIETDLAGVSERAGSDLARLAYLADRRQRARRLADRRGA